ncbi:bleomycin resistance protein [Legionella birminghamensis]|uniref:Bleomycin resistance protein n=1 Tax=Legionella birminghamensis TaxID=28083 RepID=A0A378IDB1_9GAMM|nr:VOC family protein [Legionella birminghamensis]KTC72568.1 bleomycin resistance protein [Legionella birminghamensis]STX32840.1 bleomycin resistance protein [Legionella birminghamensis]
MLEPSAVIIYVNDVAVSSQFYQELTGIEPDELSPVFSAFKLQNGMTIGLKSMQSVEPPVEGRGGFELAFTVANNQQVDTLFAQWQKKGIPIAQSPTVLPYGYTFTGLDPDLNRLRVVALEK